MEFVGVNIERLQELMGTPVVPPPNWIRRWQTEAEHVLHLAHCAKDELDIEQLRMLDQEAVRLIGEREAKMSKK